MPALLTPFDNAGLIDIDAHRDNVEMTVAKGVEGILIAGSTGEGPYLESGEREELLSVARASDSGLTLICGIAAESDRQVGRQISEAASGGADAVLVLTPGTLVRGRTPLIRDFFVRVAETSPIPVLLYTNPPVTGYALPTDTVAELAQHPNIVGMKDSGGDVSRLDALSAFLEGFPVWAGSSKALADSAAHGAFGAITASSNYAWQHADAAVSGDMDAQAALTAVTNTVQRYGVQGTKFAAGLVGLHAGHSRLPLQPLGPDAQSEITSALRELTLDS